MNAKKEKKLIYLLYQIKEALDEEEIEFWLECGTLLGAVRDGKIITWEHDLDFGVFREKFPYNLQVLIAKKLSDKGFKVVINKNYLHISIGIDERMWADINYYHITNEKAIVPHTKPKNTIGKLLIIIYNVFVDPYEHKKFKKKYVIFIRNIFILISRMLPTLLRKHIAKIIFKVYEKIGSKDVWWIVPSYYLTNLSLINFYGKEFKVPNKVDDYLAYRYGKSWKVPQKYWVTERDDGAVSNFYHK